MSLADRNALLEDENKRLKQELETLDQNIRKTQEAIEQQRLLHQKAPQVEPLSLAAPAAQHVQHVPKPEGPQAR
ncbi:unnamed protein product [Effrenium voratum]|nr:unnamed protein product [Effrenium voratum]